MAVQVQEFAVFVASPSDCEDERAEVRKVVEELNESLRDFPMSFRVTGWETTNPDLGRAQSLINPLVESCDVFIGILANRWGTPTGEATSGFSEEFRIAQKRRDVDAAPHIAMHFRRPPSAMLRDPGAELAKVLEFKREISVGGVALYREHTDVNEFARQVASELHAYAIRRIGSAETVGGSSGSTPGTREASNSAAETAGDVARDGARAELLATAESMRATFAGELTKMFDQDRILLIAKAFSIDNELLPAHLANRLYWRRRELTLAYGEWRTILQSVLADIGPDQGSLNRVVPGWGFVLSDAKNALSADTAQEIAKVAESREFRASCGALSVLRASGKRPARLWPRANARAVHKQIRRAWLGMFEGSNTDLVVDYAARVLRPSDKTLFEALRTDVDFVEFDDELCALEGLAAGQPDLLLRHGLVRGSHLRAWCEEKLPNSITDLDDEVLASVLLKSWVEPATRMLALDEVLRRGLMSQKLFDKVLSSSPLLVDRVFDVVSSDAQLASYLTTTLGRMGDAKPKPDVLRRARKIALKGATLSELDPTRLSFGDDWEAICANDPAAHLDDARDILDSSGATHQAGLQESGAFVGDNGLIGFLVAKLRRAAVVVLVEGGGSGVADRARIRRELADSDYGYVTREAAAAAFLKLADFDDPEDAQALASIEPVMLTEGVAARLERGDETLARLAMDLDDGNVRSAAIRSLGSSGHLTTDALIELLYDQTPRVRVTAADVLTARLSSDELLEVLNSYSKTDGTYWYNVVVCLDEALYGPRNFQVAEQRARSAV